MPKRAKGSSRNTSNICATCSRPFKNGLTGREAREKEGREAREKEGREAREKEGREAREAREKEGREAREAREAREKEARESSDEEDDVPILELVRRGDFIDTEWRAPGRGKVYEIYKIVDWKVDDADAYSHRTDRRRTIFFLVWWKGYTLSESTWEPASGIHPVEQVRFFKSVGVFD